MPLTTEVFKPTAQQTLGAAMAKLDAGIFDITMVLHHHQHDLTDVERADLTAKKLELCKTLAALEDFYHNKFPE